MQEAERLAREQAAEKARRDMTECEGKERDGRKLSKVLWSDRLRLEWKMKKMLGLALNFDLILILFLLNLNLERPVGAMYEVSSNLRFHFHLEDVYAINTFQGVYGFLYDFLEAAERFDPLDVDKYVSREYDTASFDPSVTSAVDLTKLKRFTAVTATVLRPQIWMTRRSAVPCRGFSTVYDRIYSMSRYQRFKYRGAAIPGGWQPTQVEYRSSEAAPYMSLSRRGSANPPPAESTYHGPDGRSLLLTCVSPDEHNDTMRNVLLERFNNVILEDEGTTYFGDFHASKVDILAYMGYNVYASTINLTTHPRCFMTSVRNAEGEIDWYINDIGAIVRNGSKVTFSDVDLRCEKTAQTWHDVQTDLIMAEITLYTPSYEIFTRLHVEWKIEMSGMFTPTFDVVSFQDLKNSDRFQAWLGLTVVQIFLGIVQAVLMARRAVVEMREAKEFPRVDSFGRGAKLQLAFGVVVQVGFMTFYIYRLIQETTSDNLWHRIETLLSLNPYASPEAAAEFINHQNQINHFSDSYLTLRVMGFVLVFASFFQMIGYMSVHPQLGLIANTLHVVFAGMANWLLIFFMVFLTLLFLGTWAFGESMKVFSQLRPAIIMAANMAMGSFSFMEGRESLATETERVLLAFWGVAMLGLIFLVLLNFLLAIVVDGYAEVKESFERSTAGNFLSDVVSYFWVETQYRRKGWPERGMVLEKFMDLPDFLSVEDLISSGLFDADHQNEAQIFFDAYFGMIGHMPFGDTEETPLSLESLKAALRDEAKLIARAMLEEMKAAEKDKDAQEMKDDLLAMKVPLEVDIEVDHADRVEI